VTLAESKVVNIKKIARSLLQTQDTFVLLYSLLCYCWLICLKLTTLL